MRATLADIKAFLEKNDGGVMAVEEIGTAGVTRALVAFSPIVAEEFLSEDDEKFAWAFVGDDRGHVADVDSIEWDGDLEYTLEGSMDTPTSRGVRRRYTVTVAWKVEHFADIGRWREIAKPPREQMIAELRALLG